MAWVLKKQTAFENYVGRKLVAKPKWLAAIPSAIYMRWMNVQMANVIIEDGIEKQN
jgi:hypothetical protein